MHFFSYSSLSVEQIRKGYADRKRGRAKPAKKVFAYIHKGKINFENY